MATFLDVTGLQQFSSIFVFLFVWIVVYAILANVRIFAGNKAIGALIGLIIGIFVLFSPLAVGAVSYMAPWFGFLLVASIMVLVGFKMLGISSTELVGGPGMKFGVIMIVLIFLTVGLASYTREAVSVPGDNETGEPSYTGAAALWHPKILGIIMIFLVAIFTIVLLAGKSTL